MKIWKDIPGHKNYQASSFGNIKSFKRYEDGKILKKHINRYGYNIVSLSNNGKNKTFALHRLILATFEGYSELEVNHKDGNPLNNNLENLEYCTRSENLLHRHRVLGRNPRVGKSNIKNAVKFNGPVFQKEKIFLSKEIGYLTPSCYESTLGGKKILKMVEKFFFNIKTSSFSVLCRLLTTKSFSQKR